jgi:hypothetical protein
MSPAGKLMFFQYLLKMSGQFVTPQTGEMILKNSSSLSLIMLPPKQHKAYIDFYDAVRDQGDLDERTVAIVGLTAAISREFMP